MKLTEARQLIKNTFESLFTKESFAYFIKNLLKDSYEERSNIQVGGQIPEAFENYIRKMERIGKYIDSEGCITDILMIELKREHSVEFARTTQRNFIRRYLNGSRGGELKDAALAAFYTEGSVDWRFSLIKMQYSLEKKKDDLTPAKRFSFLVGKNEKSHTAQKQLAQLLVSDNVPALSEIESAFNIETVTKEFFEKYKELFITLNEYFDEEFKRSKKLCEELKSKDIDSISFSKKLLGQIVFLYFLQKKGWLGVPKNGKWGEGDKKFLRTLFKKAKAEDKNFFNDYLEFLFYEALAEERKTSADPAYYKKLDCKIPFLNGGLFEAEYDWENIVTNIPNLFFSNTVETKEGDIGNGILDVFDRFNFTVKEDEPLDKEVAVDPEMLGKVFENLLDVTDRKSKGAFYTPREIVHYMCQESLINYLNTSLNPEPVSYNELGNPQTGLFGNDSRQGQLSMETINAIEIYLPREDIEKFIREGISAIDNDVRVEKAGKETERYSYFIPGSIRTNAKIIDEALANIRVCDPAIGSGAFPVGMMNEIVKARLILKTYLPAKEQKNITSYDFKRHCIQESIYGVDIEHSAVDIAKLRLWLSLVVDEEDLTYIKPLPNLDYKIVQGNSLIGMPYEPKAIDKLEILKKKFFDLTSHKEKEKYRLLINEEIQKILKIGSNQIKHTIDFDFKLFFSEVFKEKKGFDVVIGNPPYVDHKRLKEISPFFKGYSTYNGKNDLFVYFYEKGIILLKNKGILCFITSNKWIRSEYGRNLRKFLLQKTNPLFLIDFGINRVFDATVDSNILLIQNSVNENIFKISTVSEKVTDTNNLSEFLYQNFSPSPKFTDEIWLLSTGPINTLKEKIEKKGKPLKDFEVKIYRGIGNGLNEAFIIDEDLKNKLISSDKKSKELIIPLLKGNNIGKYIVDWSGLYLIFAHRSYKIKEYKAIYSHLLKFKSKLEKRLNVVRDGEFWWQIPYAISYKDCFSNEKIIWQSVAKRIEFSYDYEGFYTDVTTFIMSGKNLKYLISILNSSFFKYALINIYLEGDTFKSKNQILQNFPIPVPKGNLKQSLENSVDKILSAKKADPSANTTKWEKQIDIMVYKLYELTYNEVKIIEPEFEMSEEEYEKLDFGFEYEQPEEPEFVSKPIEKKSVRRKTNESIQGLEL